MHVMLTVNAAWNIWNFRLPIVTSLLADGARVTVLAPPDAAVPLLQKAGCRFIPLRMDVKGTNPLRDYRLIKDFRRIFAQEKPDVVLSYTIKNNLFGALAAKAQGIRFIPNVSGLGTAFLSGGVLQRIAEALYRRAFAGLPTVFFQNDEDSALFVGRGLVKKDQVRLLPGSGIDLKYFSAAPYSEAAEPVVFLMIARLLRDKGVLEYAEAARQIRKDNPEVRFQLLGAIGAENRTAISADLVATWQADGIIEYLGTTDDVRPVIAASHCVVLPSYREGAPRTLIEAAAMARPVITTDVPGCRSVVEPDKTGFLCAPRDATSLARACLRFLHMVTEEREEMGLAGRHLMEMRFDHRRVVESYRDTIAQLLERSSKAHE